MPVFLLNDQLVFPPPELATEDGLIAVGGDASPERLVLAYSQGIFPWPARGMPLLWFSPDPRFVLDPADLHVSRSLRKTLRRATYEVRVDTVFDAVIEACARVPRPSQDGTWITDQLLEGYRNLHALGYAHSVEAWRDGELVGGLYGVSLGAAFFGESMFADARDASKVAFVALFGQLVDWGFSLMDCQVHTDHLASLGAHEIPRERFLSRLRQALQAETRRGTWTFDLSPEEALARLDRTGSAGT